MTDRRADDIRRSPAATRRSAVRFGRATGLALPFAVVAVAATLSAFARIVRDYLTIRYDVWFELGMVLGQVLFQWAALWRRSWTERLDYTVILVLVSAVGAALLWPLLLWHHLAPVRPITAAVYFVAVVAVMFGVHLRLVRRAALPLVLCLTWVVYRLLILLVVLPYGRTMGGTTIRADEPWSAPQSWYPRTVGRCAATLSRPPPLRVRLSRIDPCVAPPANDSRWHARCNLASHAVARPANPPHLPPRSDSLWRASPRACAAPLAGRPTLTRPSHTTCARRGVSASPRPLDRRGHARRPRGSDALARRRGMSRCTRRIVSC